MNNIIRVVPLETEPKRFAAWLEGNETDYVTGDSVAEAVGNLIKTNSENFSITVIEEK